MKCRPMSQFGPSGARSRRPHRLQQQTLSADETAPQHRLQPDPVCWGANEPSWSLTSAGLGSGVRRFEIPIFLVGTVKTGSGGESKLFRDEVRTDPPTIRETPATHCPRAAHSLCRIPVWGNHFGSCRIIPAGRINSKRFERRSSAV